MTMRKTVKALVDAYNDQRPSVCDAMEMNALDAAGRLDAELARIGAAYDALRSASEETAAKCAAAESELAALKREKAEAAKAYRRLRDHAKQPGMEVVMDLDDLDRYFGRE